MEITEGVKTNRTILVILGIYFIVLFLAIFQKEYENSKHTVKFKQSVSDTLAVP